MLFMIAARLGPPFIFEVNLLLLVASFFSHIS